MSPEPGHTETIPLQQRTNRRQTRPAAQSNGLVVSLWDVSVPEDSVINSKAPSLKLSMPEWDIDTKCDKHSRSRKGECCKDLKGKEERHLLNPDVVRDAIIGLSDGLTVPFALTAGLSSLGNSKLVVLGGVAELIAGTISMGVGGFLGSQSERHHYFYRFKQVTSRINRSCAGQMEREVHEVLGAVGVSEKSSRQVADDLLRYHGPEGENKDSGIAAFFLRFGEGLEEIPTRRLFISAFTIGVGYLIGGLIPLFPYFFISEARVALFWSCIVTGITLLLFGVVRTYVTGAKGGLGGYLWGAISTLCVGGAAAAAAYGIVLAVSHAE
ncbi:DUF125-domain-containing protein [Schizopora paradoxa]|uniref:DUF125-domain-containing protein n=1 Tax=Schizopora paradoxa TaxID=27342 RepID=A0A0H2RVC1_9AGAM|nr:DUF125-domain-containing protein [Schizopora paradoxa]